MLLKDELAQAHAKMDCSKTSKHHEPSSHQQALEQTVLTMKRVVDKLRVENKHLKENKKEVSSVPSTSKYMNQTDRRKEELFEKLRNEHDKLLKRYADMINRISALEVELELSQAQAINVSCPHCNGQNLSELAAQGDADVLSQQLQQKSMLMEKAKSLLTRAAVKEKHLREQIAYLKKRVCDLEGVPVISEEDSTG